MVEKEVRIYDVCEKKGRFCEGRERLWLEGSLWREGTSVKRGNVWAE